MEWIPTDLLLLYHLQYQIWSLSRRCILDNPEKNRELEEKKGRQSRPHNLPLTSPGGEPDFVSKADPDP